MGDIITDIMLREGWDKMTNDPLDKGGRTQFGISEKSNPLAWTDNHVTEAEARAIYTRKYVEGPGFARIKDKQLQALLVDWGVTSGPGVAIRGLQRVVGSKDDGVLGAHTLARLADRDPREVINKVVAERIKMIVRVVVAQPNQLRFLAGWINRCCEWLN